jgi:hypothetical protein
LYMPRAKALCGGGGGRGAPWGEGATSRHRSGSSPVLKGRATVTR